MRKYLQLTIAISIAAATCSPVFAQSPVAIDPPSDPVVLPRAELQMTLALDRTTVTVPATVTLTLIVTNTGAVSATDVVLVPEIPVGFKRIDTTDLSSIGALAPGDTISKQLQLSLPAGTPTDRYVTEVIASAANADSVQADVGLDVSGGRVLGSATELAQTGAMPWQVVTLGFVLLAFGWRLRRSTRPFRG